MERLRIASLQVGQTFPLALFSLSGQKLLGAGTPMTGTHVEAIRRCGDMEVVTAESFDELVSAGIVTHVDHSLLKVGQRSDHGVITGGGHVLIEPGDEVEEHHLDAVEAGRGAFVSKNPTQQRRQRIMMSDALLEALDAQVKHLKLRVSPESDSDWVQPGDPAKWPNPEELTAWRSQEVSTLRAIYARIEAGLPVQLEMVTALVDALLRRLAVQPTRFTQLALLCPRREDYLPDHAYTVTVLAMSIATQMGWSVEDVREVGRAGMLFDLGMLLIPERIRTGGCELADLDRSRVQRHPVFSLAMLQVFDTMPPLIQLAALQHHERENGTGYPRGARRDGVCDYAKVLAVADTFAAATEPRHYRKPKLPYTAMEETLRSTTAMALWKPAVRALLQAAGLFPVGSFVKLSNGKNAHVYATNPRQLDRPTIQVLKATGEPDGAPIDLISIPPDELSIVRPIHSRTG